MAETEKLLAGVKYAKDGIDKIRSRSWAEPTGIALGVTASICKHLAFIPGVSLVGGALGMGASLLNPAPTLADLKRQIQELKEHSESSHGTVKEVLELQITNLKVEMENTAKELLDNMNVIKFEVQSVVNQITKDMPRIQSGLDNIKTAIKKTYMMVTDHRYRDGIERVDAAYENFVLGSSNLEDTFKSLETYMFELQTVAIQNLNPRRIEEYLRAIQYDGSVDLCEHVYNYVLVVRAKYLQISVAYYLYKNDSIRITNEFETFNRQFYELESIYTEITQTFSKSEPSRPCILSDMTSVKDNVEGNLPFYLKLHLLLFNRLSYRGEFSTCIVLL